MLLQRAFSLLEVKAVDEDQRVITGIATTPATDRVDDIVEPKGAEFKLPIPFLWMHRSDQPIGEVFAAKVTAAGIEIKARIVKVEEPGTLKDRVDEAWQSIKLGLVRGLSIGFKSIEHTHIDGSFGMRFIKWLWLELSAVTIPSNAEASIQTVKSIDAHHRALSGNGERRGVRIQVGVPATSGTGRDMKKTYSEQIAALEATQTAKNARLEEIQTKASDENRTKDTTEKEEFDTLKRELDDIAVEIKDLRDLETRAKAAAKPVVGATQDEASRSRGGVTTVSDTIPKGIGFARYAIAGIMARKNGTTIEAFAKQRWPDHSHLHAFIQKATIPAGLTTDATWAGNLVDPTNLASEFIEYLRPMTIVGRIPGLRRVPFNVRITGQSTGSVANWVGQGKPKPVTSFGTTATTLLYTKIAAIAVITEELARFSSPSAEMLVRDELARAVIERMDIDFIDPAQAAVANVSPASITNGVTPLSPSGTNEAAVRADIITLLAQFMENNVDVSGLVLVMPNTLAMATAMMVNSLGQPSFPGMGMNGGTLLGIPVVASMYAGNQSGAGNLVIALNARDIALADDGEVAIDSSREASIQMSDAPTNDASTGTGQSLVSMYQTNSIAIRAERFINWAKLRTTAVVFMDDVNWGSVGSPS